MKSKHIICFYIFLAGLCFTATSCEDMLTPDMERYAEGTSPIDTVNDYLGVVKNLQEVIEQHQLMGDLRSDLVASTPYTSDSISGIMNLTELTNGQSTLLNRAAYYKVINQCNFYLSAVDMDAKKNNVYIMRKEAAQVRIIRAWTYMQLVLAYGKVPFITTPITEANSEVAANAPIATADNLLDLLLQHGGLQEAYEIEMSQGVPQYGTFNTGAVTVVHDVMIFPAELVMADLYMLRGRQSDFEEAATLYYQFLVDYQRNRSFSLKAESAASYKVTDKDGKEEAEGNATSWIAQITHGENIVAGSELITVIPSAANHTFGTMLTKIPGIYGFNVSSFNNQEGDATSGKVSLYADYKLRQVQPSQRYENVTLSQLYYYEDNKLPTYSSVGDARINGTAPIVRSEDGDGRFIQKYGASKTVGSKGDAGANSFEYRYCIPVYRYTQVMLRYAEAINRAGFPRHAYAILTADTKNSYMPALADTLRFTKTDDSEVCDSTKAVRDYYFVGEEDGNEGADMHFFIGVDEMRRAATKDYLDLTLSVWDNIGVHTKGSGKFSFEDKLRTYDNVVAQRVAEEKQRSFIEFQETSEGITSEVLETVDVLQFGTDDVWEEMEVLVTSTTPAGPIEAEINAISTLIADELALEMAFEGTRLYDLIRIARHMNNTRGDYGTTWLAWTIARRAVDAAPYENPQEVDQSLFNHLMNQDNWYLPNP